MEKKVLFLWIAVVLSFFEVQFSLFSGALDKLLTWFFAPRMAAIINTAKQLPRDQMVPYVTQSMASYTPLISVISIIKAVIVIVLLSFMARFWLSWYKQEPMQSLRYYVVACFVFFHSIANYSFGAGVFAISLFSLIFIWHHFKSVKAVVVIALYGLVSSALIIFVINEFYTNYLVFFGGGLSELFLLLVIVLAFIAGYASCLAIFMRAKLADLKDLFLHDFGLVLLILLPCLIISAVLHFIQTL